MTQDSILRFAGFFSPSEKCSEKSVPVRGFPKILWHGTYLYAIYKSAIFRDLSFFHRFALIKKMAWQFFFIVGNWHPRCFFGRKRPCEMMIFGPGPIGGLNSRSWVSGKVSNALEMRGASYDARNTRSGLLAYIHTPRVWFVDIWPMVQDSPSRGNHICRKSCRRSYNHPGSRILDAPVWSHQSQMQALALTRSAQPGTRPLGIGIGYLVGNPCPGFSTSLGHCLTFHCQLKNTCRKNIVNLSNHRIIQISPKNTPTATTWWVVFCRLGETCQLNNSRNVDCRRRLGDKCKAQLAAEPSKELLRSNSHLPKIPQETVRPM